MGLLSLGTPLDWKDVKPHIDHVKKHGIIQFLNIWNTVKTRRRDHLLWGEEVEYVVVALDDTKKTAKLVLDADETLHELERLELAAIKEGKTFDSSWKPEYGRYMLEGTPGLPYGATLDDLLLVEKNMISRRQLATSLLKPGQVLFSLTNFPLLGANEFATPHFEPTPTSGCSRSLFIPNEAITKHARFPTLTANIRQRRGEKVAINLPIFKDKYTPSPFREPLPKSVLALYESQSGSIPSSLPDYEPAAKEDHVYMDCMCFGMGCSCLQVTLQACSVENGRRLYDHLTVLTPILLALSASGPIYRGYLTDVDCRWNVIANSVDDRNREERGLEPLVNSKFRIPKSRYESVSRYLSPGPNVSGLCSTNPDYSKAVEGSHYFKDAYNDIDSPIDNDVYKQLVDGGVDELLAKHYAHLFIRDPLVVFNELLNVNDADSSDHFENIQSTNWQTMRFKPPTPNSKIGWRVEFRSMDIQLTDYENAAYSIFIVLLARTIKHYNLNMYIPLSKVDDNMQRAQKRNAVLEQKFWFRHSVLPEGYTETDDITSEYKEYSIADIMVGTSTTPGICCLIDRYLDETEVADPKNLGESSVSLSTRETLKAQVNLIRQRALGTRQTGAAWIREFVQNHPLYNHDSIVTPEINYDLLKKINVLDPDELLKK
ncbi:glutamate-cysteine ligase-domain-containing protein [Globomyces pollinis-pini]|nr:glutamate-cysteine ligase-domain-containing protein [Globomyces pollinis-pini]